MSGVDLVTPPAAEPITLAQAKAHLRVESDYDDTQISGLITASREAVEAYTRRTLLHTVWEYRMDGCFPWEIRLPRGPLRTTTGLAITYVDDAGDTQTLAADQYQVSLGNVGVIRPAYGLTWPTTRSQMDAVAVQFTAGEASASLIPGALLTGLLMELGNRYAYRESVTVQVMDISALSARNLLTPFVIHD